MNVCDGTASAAKKKRKSDKNASVWRCGGPEAKRDCARRDGAGLTEHGVSEAESAELAACARAVEGFE